MVSILYVSAAGLEQRRKKIRELEEELKRLQSLTAEAAEVGGNQYHDNASYEYLLVQIRTADCRLSEAIRELNQMQVVQYPKSPSRVELGTSVDVFIDQRSERWHIVGYGEADWEKKRISYGAPIAKLIIGASATETRRGNIGGKVVVITVLSISALEEG